MRTPFFILLEVDKSVVMLEAEGPTDYAHEVTGKLTWLQTDDRRVLAGRFRLFYLDIGAAMNDGLPIFDVFDGRGETLDYFYEIFDTTNDRIGPSAKLEHLLGGPMYMGNILILDRLEILPRFRGYNLGLLVMRRLIQRFGAGAETVAIKPYPLQFECEPHEPDPWRGRLKLAGLHQNQSQATAYLRRHYRKLGFKHMRGTPFMFRLAEAPLPGIADLEA